MLKIKWFGHSMWKIWDEHVSIITDPFTDIGYPLPENEKADIVLSSHDHFDHNNFKLIKGDYLKVDKTGEFSHKGVSIKNIHTWHDTSAGKDRGDNLLMRFSIGGKTFLHCGDLGHMIGKDILDQLGKIDVLLIPVGGHFTIDSLSAKKIADMIDPILTFPMHYKTNVLDFPIAHKEEYLKLVNDHQHIDNNEIALTKELFSEKRTLTLNYS